MSKYIIVFSGSGYKIGEFTASGGRSADRKYSAFLDENVKFECYNRVRKYKVGVNSYGKGVCMRE